MGGLQSDTLHVSDKICSMDWELCHHCLSCGPEERISTRKVRENQERKLTFQ
jgi:hypothetical protein